MNIKKSLTLLCVLLLPVFVFAIPDRIVGELTNSTCNVTIADSISTGNSLIVEMPTVSSSDLTINQVSTEIKDFDFVITECVASGENTMVAISINPKTVTLSGNLLNSATTSAATNVSVQLIDRSRNQVINFNKGAYLTQKKSIPSSDVTNTVSFPMSVRYYAEDQMNVNAGRVQTGIYYGFAYE